MVSSSPPLLLTVSLPSTPTSLLTMEMKKQGSSSTGLSSSTAYSPSISNGYSTPPTSVSDSHRWSEVIPPKTALTFAVVWDPDADMVAFSGAHFLDAVDATSTSPTDAYSVAASSTLRWFQDNHEYLFSDESSQTDRAMAGQTQTSSLLMQPDIEYHRRSRELGRRNTNRYFSCLEDLGKDVSFDPRTDFAKKWIEFLQEQSMQRDDDEEVEEDEGFYDSTALNARRELQARRTTFTASFVAINSDDALSAWSAVTPPEGYDPANTLGRRLRRLRKPRPSEKPASPLVVLGRDTYNHSTPTRSPTITSRLPPLPKCISRWKSTKGKHFSWICVDVTQEVTQRRL